MINKLFQYSLLIAISLGFTGCLEEEIACNNEVAQSIVEELSQETIKYALMIQERNKELINEGKEPMSAIGNAFIMQIIKVQENKEDSIMSNISKKVKHNMRPEYFSLDSFMTTKKDKELSQVECAAIAHYRYDNDIYNFNTTYTAQLTDDKEEVFVTLNSFDFKE